MLQPDVQNCDVKSVVTQVASLIHIFNVVNVIHVTSDLSDKILLNPDYHFSYSLLFSS